MKMQLNSADHETAIGELYNASAAHIYKAAVKAVGSAAEAEEIVSEVFVRIWKHPDYYLSKESCELATLLDLIVKRRAKDAKRRVKSRPVIAGSLDDPAFFSAHVYCITSAEDTAEDYQNKALLLDAIQKLPKNSRYALYGKYILGLTDAEIGEALGIKPVSVRVCLSRARQRAKAILEEEGIYEQV